MKHIATNKLLRFGVWFRYRNKKNKTLSINFTLVIEFQRLLWNFQYLIIYQSISECFFFRWIFMPTKCNYSCVRKIILQKTEIILGCSLATGAHKQATLWFLSFEEDSHERREEWSRIINNKTRYERKKTKKEKKLEINNPSLPATSRMQS